MAVDTEAKRWSMLGFASGVGRNIVFNPDTSGLVSIEKITVLKHYGGIAWDEAEAVEEAKPDGAGGHKHDEVRRRVLVGPSPFPATQPEAPEAEQEAVDEAVALPKRPKLKLRKDTIETMPFTPTALDESLISELQEAQRRYRHRQEEELLLFMVID